MPKKPTRTTDRRRGAKTPPPIEQVKTTPYNDPFGRNEVSSEETNASYQRALANFNDRRRV